MLLLSYCCLLLPWPVRYVGSALRQLGTNLEPAARVHGASPLQALRLIVLPLVFPALLAAMLMVFAVASRELVTSLLLAPAGTQTVAVFIWRQFEQGRSAGHGDGLADAVDRSGVDARRAGADAARHARLTVNAQNMQSGGKNRL
jgi:iron(III) transport system permease protein